ncbi:hypothetical protein ABB37_09361 [Leptomonas pyrrhocoris]|uniref:Uncharacterized protein n=1 Tax=Leptomonas pyrrhocoris TaxID=157538 RepID=A0A0M9FQY4_LEPPY|nr:hypothetical protein ABB37_09361 [Leptomonas pyrrhocoris]XP_015652496.1 hypothetical protein ABB37_09361 [Leptomonas pyrrhocoris]KPA74056.1 hypothetical protein ABB37_09361 [Leptomonas pyrrhocoris]KPA74057.1 hypothetical protein ABB37_09361 [Leptomonas pyrrhocoris]|eukprot:XP_015652495.1 hypothetical protein ABB37_09361 [Leptomonas pyrrhocoris]
MHSSDDDVVIIDSASASDVGSLQEPAQLNSSRSSDQFSADGDAEEADAEQHVRGAAAASRGRQQRGTTYDATCQRLQEQLRSFPKLRMEVDTQTDGSASDEVAETLHRHLIDLDSALGIRVAVPTAALTNSRGAISQFVAAWREGSRVPKRPRHDMPAAPPSQSEGKESGTAAAKCAKEEGARSSSSTVFDPSSPPAWADELGTALEQCRRLLQSTPMAATGRGEGGGGDTCRARLASFPLEPSAAAPSSLSPNETFSSFPQKEHVAQRGSDGGGNAASHGDGSSSLLREAEIICAREHKSSLLPLYAELHTLRRQNTHEQQEQSQSVARELQWEQRLLTDVLTECDAQLDFMNTNFIECCRGNLAPLEALQRRMEALQTFERQLHAAEAASASLSSVQAASQRVPNTQVQSTDAVTAQWTPRPLGKAAEVFMKHLEEERLRLQADLDAARTRLREQGKQISDLQACYAHATSQVQRALDAEHYVDKGAIDALKQQQRETLAALARQFGWVLLNSTPDVLSLRHPRSGEVLHANHTYASINGKPCGDVAKALAEYVVRHAATEDTADVVDHVATLHTHDDQEAVEAVNRAALLPTAPKTPLEEEGDALPPAPTSDDEEALEGGDDDNVAAEQDGREGEESSGEGAQSMEPSPSALNDGVEAEAAHALRAEHDRVSAVTDSASNAVSEEDSEGVGEASEESSEEGHASCSHGGAEEVGEVGSVSADASQVNTEEGAEEQEEEFVNYSNLQSDEAASSHRDDSGAVNISAESAMTKAELPQNPSNDKTNANVYTGFFTENALWEEDS